MKKQTVYEAITSALRKRFDTALWAAKQAHDAATNEESVAENKYDTFGLEASYLAHGQSQRVIDCENDWRTFEKKGCVLFEDSSTVALWALVELSALEKNTFHTKWFFISPCAGGLTVEQSQQSVFLVTPSSPVGKVLIGKEEGDEVCLRQNGLEVVYEITRVC
ncbi:GreA/GreB family elongation factor [Marinomonas spartinae]|uniref:GreA/GreB family elongation factor n=1 Tax=Marinomonas spartinae TaxID=1792290 RepID=UPI0018F19B09|nr:GreA/GreB family elongation factor [Marinomonas spartinae]MBJ7554064.1 GreA/GreB family elongation factor [Marinomonas spartinae]